MQYLKNYERFRLTIRNVNFTEDTENFKALPCFRLTIRNVNEIRQFVKSTENVVLD